MGKECEKVMGVKKKEKKLNEKQWVGQVKGCGSGQITDRGREKEEEDQHF